MAKLKSPLASRILSGDEKTVLVFGLAFKITRSSSGWIELGKNARHGPVCGDDTIKYLVQRGLMDANFDLSELQHLNGSRPLPEERELIVTTNHRGWAVYDWYAAEFEIESDSIH